MKKRNERIRRVHYVDGDAIMAKFPPDEMAKLKGFYKDVGMVK